jgi:hypothetical protein
MHPTLVEAGMRARNEERLAQAARWHHFHEDLDPEERPGLRLRVHLVTLFTRRRVRRQQVPAVVPAVSATLAGEVKAAFLAQWHWAGEQDGLLERALIVSPLAQAEQVRQQVKAPIDWDQASQDLTASILLYLEEQEVADGTFHDTFPHRAQLLDQLIVH